MMTLNITLLGLATQKEKSITLPTEENMIENLIEQIGTQEYLITDYSSDVDTFRVPEIVSLKLLNRLVKEFNQRSPYEQEKYATLVETTDYTESVEDLYDLLGNLDKYVFYPELQNENLYGEYLLNMRDDIPEDLRIYIDTENLGRDAAINCGGRFSSKGLVINDYSVVFNHRTSN